MIGGISQCTLEGMTGTWRLGLSTKKAQGGSKQEDRVDRSYDSGVRVCAPVSGGPS